MQKLSILLFLFLSTLNVQAHEVASVETNGDQTVKYWFLEEID